MRIGYGKIGRNLNMNPASWSAAGGDVDVCRFLHRIATERPQDTFVMLSRNSDYDLQALGYPPNIVNLWTPEIRQQRKELCSMRHSPMLREEMIEVSEGMKDITRHMYDDLDAIIMWAGQHGTSNSTIPDVPNSKMTNPQDSFVYYVGFLVNGINRWRWHDPIAREEVWLCPDPRNYIKARDLAYPLVRPILAQYEQERTMKHERYGDPRSPREVGFKGEWENTHWVTKTPYVYSGLELTAIPNTFRTELPAVDLTGRSEFGLIMNENRKQVSLPRKDVMMQWILPRWPEVEVYGNWTKASLSEMGRPDIETCDVTEVGEVIARWRSTFTTPASGTGWATAKPWECFAAGTVCFFHPKYDTQGWVIPTLEQVKKGGVDEDTAALARWLRVETPEQLQKRVQHLAKSDTDYAWLVEAQRARLTTELQRDLIGTMVNARLDG